MIVLKVVDVDGRGGESGLGSNCSGRDGGGVCFRFCLKEKISDALFVKTSCG